MLRRFVLVLLAVPLLALAQAPIEGAMRPSVIGRAWVVADVSSGQILAAEKPDERFKCTVYLLDARLRADALNVAVFKQTRDVSGNWVDAASTAQTETDIENATLTKARQLRLSNIRG